MPVGKTGNTPKTGNLRCDIGFAPVFSTGKIRRLDVSQICQKTAGTE